MPSRSLTSGLTAITGLMLFTASSHAALYHIEINTSVLNLPANSSNGPYSIDFQLNSGSTLNNNTAVMSNFTFGGGGGTFGTATFLGGASGGLASTITLSDTSAFNEFFQSFVAGSVFAFDLSLTQNVDAGPTPDAFAVSILDKNLFNIPTNSTDGANTLLHGDITTSNPLTVRQLNFASGTGNYAGVTIAAASVPDTGTTILLWVFALSGIVAANRYAARPSAA